MCTHAPCIFYVGLRPGGLCLDTPRALVQNARPRRAGRAVECTSLENWQGFAPFVSSNLTPSANSYSIHAACSVNASHLSYSCSYPIILLDVKKPGTWRVSGLRNEHFKGKGVRLNN